MPAPIPRASETLAALYGAWRLLLFDKRGLQFFEASREACVSSFFAALLALPAYLILVAIHVMSWQPEAELLRLVMVHALAYVVSWTAYPLVMQPIVTYLDREQHYFGFITVFNWIRVVRVTIILAVNLLAFTGLLPQGVTAMIILAGWVGVLVYQWFVTRQTLEIDGTPAGLLVGLELFIGFCISLAADQAVN